MADMRKLINIVEAPTSSYEHRVQGVVDRVLQYHANDPLVGKEQIMDAIRSAAAGTTDYMMGGRTQKEFISDVLNGLKGQLKKPKADPALKKAEAQKKLQRIADKVNDVIGSTFPDGDPLDILYPWMLKQGFADEKVMDLLNKASRLNGYKSYYKQLEDFWDQIAADNPDGFGGSREVTKANNPWRTNEDAGAASSLDVEGVVSNILDYKLHNTIKDKAHIMQLIKHFGARFTPYKKGGMDRKKFIAEIIKVLKARMNSYDWPET